MSEWVASLTPKAAQLRPDEWARSLFSVTSKHIQHLSFEAGGFMCRLAAAAERERFLQLSRFEHQGRVVGVALDGFARCAQVAPGDAHLSMAEEVACAYFRWGCDCVHHLHGQWAFAIVEPARRCTFAARDALGTRPLYYRPNGCLIGNRARHLARTSELPACAIDDESLLECRSGVRSRPWATMFRGVRRLPPGSRMSMVDNHYSVDTWWQTEPWETDGCSTPSDHLEGFRQALVDSIRDCCDFGNRPSIALSGGVDSSTIAAIARQLADEGRIASPITISARFPSHPSCDETARIQPLLDVLRFESHWVEPDVLEPIAEVLELADTPLQAIWGPVALAIARCAAKIGSEVVVVGTLGDLIGGCPSDWDWMTGPVGCGGKEGLPTLRRASRIGRALSQNLVPYPHEWIRERNRYLCKSFRKSEFRVVENRILDLWNWMRPGPFGARAEQAFKTVSAEDTEAVAVGWNYGKHGIEAVFPFLDRRVVEASLRLPSELRRSGALNRWAARKLTAGLVPDCIRLNAHKTIYNEFYHDRFSKMSPRNAGGGESLDIQNSSLAASWNGMPSLRESVKLRQEHVFTLVDIWLSGCRQLGMESQYESEGA